MYIIYVKLSHVTTSPCPPYNLYQEISYAWIHDQYMKTTPNDLVRLRFINNVKFFSFMNMVQRHDYVWGALVSLSRVPLMDGITDCLLLCAISVHLVAWVICAPDARVWIPFWTSHCLQIWITRSCGDDDSYCTMIHILTKSHAFILCCSHHCSISPSERQAVLRNRCLLKANSSVQLVYV